MSQSLRVLIADDERPARSYLAALLRSFAEVALVGEAENGAQAVEMIERQRPELALLDLQMPELDGLTVVRLLPQSQLPLIAFVTAYDEYAVKAFELNAVDYLLKPVERARLRETIKRAQERLEQADWRGETAERLSAAAVEYQQNLRPSLLERIPVRHREDILLVPVKEIASIVAEGELLRLTTARNESYLFTYRLKDLEARLDSNTFIRLGRGTLANVEMLQRVSIMPGGTYLVTLANGQQLNVSRMQSRRLREHLLKL